MDEEQFDVHFSSRHFWLMMLMYPWRVSLLCRGSGFTLELIFHATLLPSSFIILSISRWDKRCGVFHFYIVTCWSVFLSAGWVQSLREKLLRLFVTYSYPLSFVSLLHLCLPLCPAIQLSPSIMCFSPFLITLSPFHPPPNSSHVSHLLHLLKCSTHSLSQGHF